MILALSIEINICKEVKVVKDKLKELENKVDRILEMLENKELSTSHCSLEIGKLSNLPDDVLKRNKLGKYAKN